MKSVAYKGIVLSILCLITLESRGSYVAKLFGRSQPFAQQRAYSTQTNKPKVTHHSTYGLEDALTDKLPATIYPSARGQAVDDRQLLLAKNLVDPKKAQRDPANGDYRFNIIDPYPATAAGFEYEFQRETNKYEPLLNDWFNTKIPVAIKFPGTNKTIYTAQYSLNSYKLDRNSRGALEYLLIHEAAKRNNKVLQPMLRAKMSITADKYEINNLHKYQEKATNLPKSLFSWYCHVRDFTKGGNCDAVALRHGVPATVIRGVIQHVRNTYKNQELESLAQELNAIVEKTQAPQSVPSQHQEDVVSSTTLD